MIYEPCITYCIAIIVFLNYNVHLCNVHKPRETRFWLIFTRFSFSRIENHR